MKMPTITKLPLWTELCSHKFKSALPILALEYLCCVACAPVLRRLQNILKMITPATCFALSFLRVSQRFSEKTPCACIALEKSQANLRNRELTISCPVSASSTYLFTNKY